MKQRLAIAATLLKDPQLLILDEPTNGLDPAGIREIRDTIRTLGEAGVTVLLSSHILAEVQQVCSSVTIIGNGRMLASGEVERSDRREHCATGSGCPRTPTASAVRLLGEAGFAVEPDADGVPRRDRPAGRRHHPDPGRVAAVADRAHAGTTRPRDGLPRAHLR